MQLVLLDLDSCNFKVVCVYRATVHKGSIRAVYADAINVPGYTGCVRLFTAYVYIVYIHRRKREREGGGEKEVAPGSQVFLLSNCTAKRWPTCELCGFLS